VNTSANRAHYRPNLCREPLPPPAVAIASGIGTCNAAADTSHCGGVRVRDVPYFSRRVLARPGVPSEGVIPVAAFVPLKHTLRRLAESDSEVCLTLS
jgi:hypothetical protein